MVKCILNGQVYETCPESVEESENEAKLGFRLGSTLRCMMNGVIYYPGAKSVLEAEHERELRAAALATKIIEDCFDEYGNPGVKIIYVDIGAFGSKSEAAAEHVRTIIKIEKKKEQVEGTTCPRLIFVKQDRDYWPGTENDPIVAARRAAKELRYRKEYMSRPDNLDIFVPELPEKIDPDIFDQEDDRPFIELTFRRYFDPELPGTKFIVENMGMSLRRCFHDCMMEPDLLEKWMNSSLACTSLSTNQSD